MKTLGVCGDSYMSSISFNPNDLDNGHGKHFTELLASKLDWEVVTYARGACSNQAIRLQIDEIIKHKPDLVIIGLTSPDRFEYPIHDLSTKHYFDKFKEEYKTNMYEPNDGIYNIDYVGFPDKSSEHEGFNKIKPKMISETLNNFFWNNQSKESLNKSEIRILEDWFARFYDFNWKVQQDSWIISNGLRKLMDHGIEFYCINTNLYPHEFEIFGSRIISHDSLMNPWVYYDNKNTNVKYRFHTSLEDQEKISQHWFEHLKQKLL